MVYSEVVVAPPREAAPAGSGNAALGVAVSVIPVAWLLVAVTLAIASFGGYAPFLTPADLSLPEAAAVRDHLEILRQIEGGADPNRAARIRANLVRPDEYVMTPLEAAVASRRLDTVELLQHHGARVDGTTLPSLLCMARRQSTDDITAYLWTQAPAHFVLQCDGVSLPWTD